MELVPITTLKALCLCGSAIQSIVTHLIMYCGKEGGKHDLKRFVQALLGRGHQKPQSPACPMSQISLESYYKCIQTYPNLRILASRSYSSPKPSLSSSNSLKSARNTAYMMILARQSRTTSRKCTEVSSALQKTVDISFHL